MSVRDSNYRSVEERPTTTIDERQHSVNPVMLTPTARYAKNEPRRTGKPSFREDFLLEHSRFGQQAESMELAGCF